MKKIWILLISILLIGCNNVVENNVSNDALVEQGAIEQEAEENDTVDTSTAKKDKGQNVDTTYKDGDLEYHITHVKSHSDDMGDYIVLGLEIYNDGSDSITFSTMQSLMLTDGNGDEALESMMVSTEGNLDITILSKGVASGEIAFELTGDDPNYLLSIGEMFADYKPALTFTSDDIGLVQEPVFQAQQVVSDYTINDPLVSDYLNVIVTKAVKTPAIEYGGRLFEADEDQAYIVVYYDIINPDAESKSFMYSMNIEAFSANSMPLDTDHGASNLYSSISGDETISGFVTYIAQDVDLDFYLMIQPDLGDMDKKYIVTFTAEIESLVIEDY